MTLWPHPLKTSLKKGLVQEGSEKSIIEESHILASLTKLNPFVPTQLLTLQSTKVGTGECFEAPVLDISLSVCLCTTKYAPVEAQINAMLLIFGRWLLWLPKAGVDLIDP